MPEGGPCAECGTTFASIWYGKKGQAKYCKKAECMRVGGYLAPKKVKAGSAAAKRARATAAEVKEEEEEIINIDLNVSEVIDIYGQRCAARRAHARAQPARGSGEGVSTPRVCTEEEVFAQ
eukprot:5076764-Prymnesium_polylepis.1